MITDTRTWRIYKYTNKVNGKVYIGQTRNSLKRRASGGSGYKNTVFAKAIKKYGWKNFEGEILQDDIRTQEEANLAEIYFINLYNSRDSNYGYNMSPGGNISKEGEPVYQYTLDGKFLEEYASANAANKKLNIDSTSILSVCNNKRMSAGGYIWSHEKHEQIEPIPLDTRTIPVYQYDMFGNYLVEYKNAFDAGIKYGNYIPHRIIECCNTGSSCKGFQWRFYKQDKIDSYCKLSKNVFQYSESGELIEKYSSCAVAAKKYNVDRHAIATSARNKNSKSCGFYWSYLELDNYFQD